ncbi:MAG: hypothetical protein FJY88_06900 [Candidatus Eisenbacteria bacterium]|nr:hypothetical protein [Candidatus Eisenbacteria bacterium]
MCRMIAAAGEFEPRALREALIRMAANDNPAHTHEKRRLGAEHRHEDGWGAAWTERGEIRVRRSPLSCLADPSVHDLDAIETDLMLLHARRASKKGSVRLANTHPFRATHAGRDWAFCHNGVVDDLGPLRAAPGLAPEGGTDSEVLFHHILSQLDPRDLESSVLRSLEPVRDYTSMHSLLMDAGSILAVAMRHPTKGVRRYHALWEGSGAGLRVVSSEPVDGIAGLARADWREIPAPGTVLLRRF